MRNLLQTEMGTNLSAVITLFCYSASLAAVVGLGYLLISLVLSVAGQQIGAIYSLHRM